MTARHVRPLSVWTLVVLLVVTPSIHSLWADDFVRGDANADESIDISDPTFILGCLFLGARCPSCRDASDANDDGEVNIGDPAYLLRFLFQGGLPPSSPYPRCAADPTEDKLDCESYPPCAATDPELEIEGETVAPDSPDDGEGEDSPDTTVDETSTRTGILQMQATAVTGPAIDGVVLQFNAVDVHRQSGVAAWLPALEDPTEVELEGDDAVEALPPVELPVGTYDDILLALADIVLVAGDEQRPIGADDLVVEMPESFQIDSGATTLLMLDFNLRGAVPSVRVIVAALEEPVELDPRQLVAMERLAEGSEEPAEFRFAHGTGAPAFIAGRWPVDPGIRGAENQAAAFINQNGPLFNLATASDAFEGKLLPLVSRIGFTNARLQQMYNGVPVHGADLVVHMLRGNVEFVNGTFVPGIDVGTVPDSTIDDAMNVARKELASRFGRIAIEEFEGPELVVYSSAVFEPNDEPINALAWFLVVRTSQPTGVWHVYVNAHTSELIRMWDNAAGIIPVDVYDAENTDSTSDDDLWYEDDGKIISGTPPADVADAKLFTHNFYLYLETKFDLDSIDGEGMKMTCRAYDPKASGKNACWGCRSNETIYLPGWVTSDVVGHEFTHGVVSKTGGGFGSGLQGRTLNEANADIFAELFDCWMESSCNWLVGTDKWGNKVPGSDGYVRDMANPTVGHMKDYDWGTDSPYKNIGIPSTVAYLLVEGGTHNGVPVSAIGKDKVEQLFFATLADAGLSSSTNFEEYRDVMLQTCREMNEFSSSDCRQVYRAWLSVGLGALTQPVIGAKNETSDYFGWSLASGNFNGDSYMDLAIGAPYEGYDDKSDTGVIFIFYGSSFGLKASGAETLAQNHIGGAMNETGDRFGWSLTVGNFDGDGFDDLAVGQPYEGLSGKSSVGMVRVLYGSTWGLKKDDAAYRWEAFHQGFSGGALESDDRFGYALAAGNFNGDGYDDLAVGIPYEHIGSTGDSGVVEIFFGSGQGLIRNDGTMSWERISQASVGAANEANDRFGFTLAAGNFDGDAYEDLAVGVPYEHVGSTSDAGVVNILYGTNAGLRKNGSVKWERLTQSWANASVESGDLFAFSLAAGNFNGDAYDDLALGSPGESFSGKSQAGTLVVYYGTNGGLYKNGSVSWERGDQTFVGGEPESGDQYSRVLAVANVNGDAYDDLAIGVPHEDFGSKSNAGVVTVLRGSNSGLFPTAWESFSEVALGGAMQTGDRFGWAVVAGDFDGNGKTDVAASAPWEDFPESLSNVGAVFVKEY